MNEVALDEKKPITESDLRWQLEDIAYRVRGLGDLLIFQDDCNDRFAAAGALVRDQGEALQSLVDRWSAMAQAQVKQDHSAAPKDDQQGANDGR